MDYQNNNMNTNNWNGNDNWNEQMNQYGMWQPPSIDHAGKRLRPIRAAIHPPQYAEAQNEGKRDAGRTRKHIFKVKTCHLTFFY